MLATRTLALVLIVAPPAAAQLPSGVTRDPAAAVFSYADMDRFAAVFERLPTVQDTAAFLDSAYLAVGSIGLEVYARNYNVTGDVLQEAIRSNPARFTAVAVHGPRAVRAIEEEIRAAYVRLASLYPEALFPPTWFLVGPHVAGGAVQREGILIAAETYASPVDSLGTLTHLVAHELAHYQQAAWNPALYQRSNTLLARAIREGGADLVAEVISGVHINPAAHEFGLRREQVLWTLFQQEMHGTETGDWFFADPADPEWPRDLGYFIGYRIARALYQGKGGGASGLAAVLRVADYKDFLESSGYAPEK